MLFSQEFEKTLRKNQHCFDPILDHDTQLFIDPFLVFKTRLPIFRHAHQKILTFFEQSFKVAAQSRGKASHPAFKKLLNMLLFPEVSELCLGYTQSSTSGSGTARGFSDTIAATILQSISSGISDISHFEELDLLGEGIGCDRISDIAANILKEELFRYTESICQSHQIPVEPYLLRNASFDFQFMRWEDRSVKLPRNPYTSEGILLVPRLFLRELPTICPEGFWDYLWDFENERMRTDFNYEIKSQMRKREIIEIAKRDRFLVRNYIEALETGTLRSNEYDLEVDDKGLYQWDRIASDYALKNPPYKFRQLVHMKSF